MSRCYICDAILKDYEMKTDPKTGKLGPCTDCKNASYDDENLDDFLDWNFDTEDVDVDRYLEDVELDGC